MNMRLTCIFIRDLDRGRDQRETSMTKPRSVAHFALFLGLCRCGGDDRSAGAPVPPDEPLYAVFTSVFDPDGRQNYVNLVPALDGSAIDLAQGIEKSGLSRFYAPEAGGYFA